MGLLDDVGDAVTDIPITTPDGYTDPETGEERPISGGTLPFGPAVGAIGNLPTRVRAGGAIAGDYLLNYGPVGQAAREADVGPGEIDVGDTLEVYDGFTTVASNWDDPDDDGNNTPMLRLALYAFVAVTALWLIRPILEIGANVTEE